MGFMGLLHWVESDECADFRYTILKTVSELCEKELKNKANEYNTPGWVNIALLVEDGMFDFLQEDDIVDADFLSIFQEVIARLEQTINALNPDITKNVSSLLNCSSDSCEFITDYTRLRDSVKAFLDRQ